MDAITGMTSAYPPRSQTRTIGLLGIHGLAVAVLALLLVATALVWPIPSLGYIYDPTDGTILQIVPGGTAEQAGLQVGDQITRLYGMPLADVLRHWSLLPLISPPPTPIPITVERQGVAITRLLPRRTPDLVFQLSKLTPIATSLIGLITGYVFGIAKQHELGASLVVAIFWLLLGGVFSVYFLASFLSIPLLVGIQWFILAGIIPLALAMQCVYPVALPPAAQWQAFRRLLIASGLVQGVLVLGISLWRPTLPALVVVLGDLVIVGFGIAFLGSGWLLARAYRRTTVAHLRRQVRIIATVCGLVGVLWVGLLVVPTVLGWPEPLPAPLVNLIPVAIPLSYLATGLADRLVRLDRALMRVSAAMLTLVGTLLLVGGVLRLPFTRAPSWWLIAGASMVSVPLYRLARRAFPDTRQTYAGIQQAITRFTTTLEIPQLAQIIHDGLWATFQPPQVVVYLRTAPEAPALTRQATAGPAFPLSIPIGALVTSISRRPLLQETRQVALDVDLARLTADEHMLLTQPGLALWAPLVDTAGTVLGLVVLGTAGDLDPYSAADRRAIQQLIDAAALVVAKSLTYTQHREATAVIRHLYQQIQQVQAEASATIARGIHDEIINLSVRLNIQALARLVPQATDPALRAELELLLESEEHVIMALRDVCEQLHPTGSDDPVGLPHLLRLQLMRLQATWSGDLQLAITGVPRPLAVGQQRNLERIAREAVLNAIKHSQGTTIRVVLAYPDDPVAPLTLTIADHGPGATPVAPQPGHWGVRNMQEEALAAGATLTWATVAGQGTTVRVSLPARVYRESSDSIAGHDRVGRLAAEGGSV